MAEFQDLDSAVKNIHVNLKGIPDIFSYSLTWDRGQVSPYIHIKRDGREPIKTCNPGWEDHGYRDNLSAAMGEGLAGKLFYVKSLCNLRLAKASQPTVGTFVTVTPRDTEHCVVTEVYSLDKSVLKLVVLLEAIRRGALVEIEPPKGE